MRATLRFFMIGRLSLLVLCLPAAALAHDFWIEPSSFRPPVGQTFTASLRVGEEFVGDPVPRISPQIERFFVRQNNHDYTVNGLEHQDPAGYLRLDTPGPAVIAFRSKPVHLDLAADKFEQFLRLQGLEKISASRASRGETAKPDRELFSRCAKSIVTVGTSSSDAGNYDPVGLRLELIPERSHKTDSASFRLLFEGKPLAGALVSALFRDIVLPKMSARTDAKGRVTLPLKQSGVWLVETVHMVAAPAGSNADWESLWASLTFER